MVLVGMWMAMCSFHLLSVDCSVVVPETADSAMGSLVPDRGMYSFRFVVAVPDLTFQIMEYAGFESYVTALTPLGFDVGRRCETRLFIVMVLTNVLYCDAPDLITIHLDPTSARSSFGRAKNAVSPELFPEMYAFDFVRSTLACSFPVTAYCAPDVFPESCVMVSLTLGELCVATIFKWTEDIFPRAAFISATSAVALGSELCRAVLGAAETGEASSKDIASADSVTVS